MKKLLFLLLLIPFFLQGQFYYANQVVKESIATFDGNNDWSDLNSDLGLDATSFTVLAKVRLDATSNERNILSCFKGATSTGLKFYFNGVNGLPIFTVNTTTITGTTDCNGNIVELAGTCDYDLNVNKLYVDGVQEGGDGVFGGASIDNGFDFAIGRQSASTASGYYKGDMFFIYVYNRVLSAAERAAVFDLNLPVSGLIAGYTFIEGAGATEYDVSGNSYHGTYSGIAAATFWEKKSAHNRYGQTYGYTQSGTTKIPALVSGVTDAAGNPIGVSRKYNKLVYKNEIKPESYANPDGTDDAVQRNALPEIVPGATTWTICMKLKTGSNITGRQALVYNRTGANSRVGVTLNLSRWYFETYDGGYDGLRVTGLSANTEYTLICTYNNGVYRLYENGVSKNNGGATGWLGGLTSDVYSVVCDNTTVPFTFKGDMYNVFTYNKVLDASERAAYIAEDFPTDQLIAGYVFIEGQGTTVFDVSGNGNHGTLFNGVGDFWAETSRDQTYGVNYGYNDVAGLTVPALVDGSADAQGNPVLNKPGSWKKIAAQARSYCQEYLAVYNNFNTKPNFIDGAKQNAYVRTLVDAGIWAKFDVFYVFASHSSDTSDALFDWINPTGAFTATTISTPLYTPYEGFTGDGSADHVNTHFIPASHGVNYTQNDASGVVYCRTDIRENNSLYGSLNTATSIGKVLFNPWATTDKYQSLFNSTGFVNLNKSALNSLGLFTMTRTATPAYTVYHNTTASAGSLATNGLSTLEVYVLAYNQDDVATAPTTRQVSIFGLGAGLSAADVTILYNATETLMDGYNKGVVP